jgi:hypothetical protein
VPRDPDDGSGPLDVDAAFAEIVARWGDDAPTRPAPGENSAEEAQDSSPRHLRDEDIKNREDHKDHKDHENHADDGDEPPAAEDRVRLVKPALPPAPKEELPAEDVSDVPSPEWFAAPRPRDEDPPELRALSEERFVPAEPGPLPRDLVGWAAWLAVVGAPLFLLVVALGWHDVPRLLTAITAGVFVAGFATLVIRLPSSRDDDDDDGAVV